MPAVPDIEEYMERCVCADCPSYPGDGGFYCAKGSSANAVERRGCDCPGCDNFEEFGLTKGYYCAQGSAEETEE